MKPRVTRLVPLFLVLLSLFLSVSASQFRASDGAHSQKPLGDRNARPSDNWGARNKHQGRGWAAYNDATALLAKLQPAAAPWWHFKKSGVFGTGAYYAKELFFVLFMNGPPQQDLLTTNPAPKKLAHPLADAATLLEEAAAEQNADAMFTLAEMNFYGNYSYPRNYTEAFRRYVDLATYSGNASAQYMVGFMYATGIGGAVRQDQAKAMLYHSLAAEQGDIRSEMTMAYRYMAGISTPRNCEESVYWYKSAADKALRYMRSGPPGGNALIKESYRIADEHGGVYGEGASVSSSGRNAKSGSVHSDAYSSFDDVYEYMDLQARKGDVKASFNLARLSYDGTRTLHRNLPEARRRFLEIARMYWPKEGKTRQNIDRETEKLAAMSAGYLGRMFLRGEGMPQSFAKAKTWFTRGIDHGEALSQYSMGLMYLNGLGVTKDAFKASSYFAAAADQDLAVAQVRMGALFLDQGDVLTAIKYFELAGRHGHLEAYYYLAELTHNGIGRDKSCHVANAYYKIVAEKAESISTSFIEANAAYNNGDLESALVGYMMAAEQGFEAGQANVAFLLDQAKPRFTMNTLIPFVRKKVSLASDAFLALIYWNRSAEQKNVDSLVKLGDYYLFGLGTRADEEKAAAAYQAAADTMASAQAMWNLGWMHENGIGIEQDFHLAKRHYDLALETNPREAYLPVVLALYKLRLRSWWNTVTHGNIKSIQDEPVIKKQWTLSEWLADFLEAEIAGWDNFDADDDWENSPMPGGDADYGYDDIDSEILESLVILALTGALAFLIYYRGQRQRRQEEERRRVEQQRVLNQQPGVGAGVGVDVGDRGLFPGPNDAEFMDWAAGGAGH
ncbi:HCP-like protein [Massarina eburnea CBS 473.64]|uniref:HCP-like protein n=1 Tax=Massarina eburnea CBS 473.64 TaxID=1395130 RepID=A0A6A6RTA5_9PLEO|nr:HCP-like protein [Massarina eburnea CBS 473.64]